MPVPGIGEAAPWFVARSPQEVDFSFSALAGRYVVLSFIGSAEPAPIRALIQALGQRRDLFDGDFALFSVVSCDIEDERQNRIAASPGTQIFWDNDGAVTRLYGLGQEREGRRMDIALASFILDPMLRVMAVIPLKDATSHASEIVAFLAHLPRLEASDASAPALLLPRAFEPVFCRQLIQMFDAGKSVDSGFMKTDPLTGKTVFRSDPALKRRRDFAIEDEGVKKEIQVRLVRRLVPEIRRVFQFQATRIERYIVARYDRSDHFKAHRDNTTKGTAHRRFAVTINLNAEEYEGGDLVFPEFGRKRWRAPTGGAVVFSCSLLHEAEPVTRGVRYCFLPFLYDEAAAKIRDENLGFVAPEQEKEKG